MTLVDPRLKTALTNPTAAGTLLNELNLEIGRCRDPNVLATLLSKYVLVAGARQSTLAAPLPSVSASVSAYARYTDTRMQTLSNTLTNIVKKVSDTSNAIVTNLK